MKFHKNVFLKENPLTLDTPVELDLVNRHTQIIGEQSAHFTGKATKLAQLYVVEGEVYGELTMTCARCLASFPYPYRVRVSETFADVEDPIEVEGDTEFIPIEGDEIELDPYLESAVLLSLPHTLRCSEDCKGICPECGVNRNETSCGCVVKRVDPRWAALGDLFKNNDE